MGKAGDRHRGRRRRPPSRRAREGERGRCTSSTRKRSPGGSVPRAHDSAGGRVIRIWTVSHTTESLVRPAHWIRAVRWSSLRSMDFSSSVRPISLKVASLGPAMLDVLPWLFLFFVPAVTMRSLAEDIQQDVQLEVVLSQPLSELELLLGIRPASVLLLWIALALTACIPLGLSLGAAIHWGTVIAQYVGAGLLAAGFAAIGTWASTRAGVRSPRRAGPGIDVGSLRIFGGSQPSVGRPSSRTLRPSRADRRAVPLPTSIGRGVLDLRTSSTSSGSRENMALGDAGPCSAGGLAPKGGAIRRLGLGVGLLTASLIVVDLLGGYIGGRLDLSPGKAYAFGRESPGRGQARRPGDYQSLRLGRATHRGRPDEARRGRPPSGRALQGYPIRVVERDPSIDQAAQKDAQSLGIEPFEFNVIGQSELQVKQATSGSPSSTATRPKPFPSCSTPITWNTGWCPRSGI